MSLFSNFNLNKLKSGLAKTRDKLVNKINETVTGRAVIDEKTLEEVEEILITSDIGYDTANKIIDEARINFKDEKSRTYNNLIDIIKNELESILSIDGAADNNILRFKPYVLLVVGINGTGKTTTVGKLAFNYRNKGLKVLLGAADTFRAAAGEQLDIWAQKAGVELIQKAKGSDPSSVAFDAVQKALNEKYDVVLIDTAGRLHNRANLMEELRKIKKVMSKVIAYAPNETLLVLDGTTGQNAIVQAEEFSKVTDITGLVITKLDGTAKGGVVFQICARQKIPVKYIGVGEGIDDLQEFNPREFVSAIFEA
ncbi:MAG TPA: signal recognition particle-docking protein FtsY [Ignavibacteriaceae bacterium]|nr:signal recognition particle-docking protein FtsY [Ignavibacteriaceae bacterium]